MDNTDRRPSAHRIFETTVRTAVVLSPSFLRVTVTGADLDNFADHGDDQRFKLVLPIDGCGFAHFPRSADWYVGWRALPDAHRCPVRTFTAAAVRPADREVDFLVARHGTMGPASRWAESAAPGDPILLVGPNAQCPDSTRAAEWAPPDGAELLIAGDETAVLAVLGILAALAPDRHGTAVLEVPCAADALAVRAPSGVEVRWLARNGRPHGALLSDAVHKVAERMFAGESDARPGSDEPTDDGSQDLLWDVATAPGDGYAWLAGEAGVIRRLRRHLVNELGVDRRAVTFMGYWRQGAAETTT